MKWTLFVVAVFTFFVVSAQYGDPFHVKNNELIEKITESHDD